MSFLKKDRNPVWFSWLDQANKDPKAQRITDRFVKRPAVELFDTQRDTGELHSLAIDPAQQKRIGLYRQELQKWMKQQGDAGAAIDIIYAGKPY